MKLRILILVFILLTSDWLSGQENNYPVTWNYRGQTFSEFVEKVESNYNLRFYFRHEWTDDIVLSDFGESPSLLKVLDGSLHSMDLHYFIYKRSDIILSKGYVIKRIDSAVQDTGKYIPSIADGVAGREISSENLFLDIGNPSEKDRPGNVFISGYVTTEDTGEPIAGVTVFNQKLTVGAITNSNGFYSLPIPRGSYSIQYSFIGMKEKRYYINLYGSGEIDVRMQSVLIPLKEAIVSAQKNRVLQRFEVGLENISILNLRLLPSSFGESDIIKSVLFVPGVKVVGEGSSGFNVRGGSTDQNLILLYGAPLYNPNHFFGFFSAVNSDIIKDVSLFKGGIPARYGGRISSVMDIVAKEGNRKEFHGNAGISPVTAHLMLEAPIIKDKCSFILTGRSTYSNWIFHRVDNPILRNSMASFYDLNGKISYDISKKNKIELASYLSDDAFRLNSDTLYKYRNRISSVKWRHFFNNRFFADLLFNDSRYKYSITSERVAEDGFRMEHSIKSSGLKADFNWYPEGRSEFNFGAEITRYSLEPGNYLPSNDSSLVIPRMIMKEKGFETAAYVEERYTLTSNLSVSAGIRFSSFFVPGPAEVMLYDPDIPRNRSTIQDTLSFTSNRIIKAYAGPEYRLSFNFRFSDNSSLKVNYNKTRQYLHLLTNTTAISPTDTWKISDYHLRPQTGDQIAVGFYRMLYKNNIETSVEAYFKTIKNMIDFKGGAKLIMNENMEAEVINVRGRAYGVELMIRSTEGRLRWSTGYTYSKTFIKSDTPFKEEQINSGKWFPANYDKPHDLVATFNYLISRRYSFSAGYTYNTGRPITYPIGVYGLGNVTVPFYSERNKYRIPDYSRLDLSFSVSGNLKQKKIGQSYWTFSVYNALSRRNVYSVYFKEDNNRLRGYQLSVFARAIPSVTYNIDF